MLTPVSRRHQIKIHNYQSAHSKQYITNCQSLYLKPPRPTIPVTNRTLDITQWQHSWSPRANRSCLWYLGTGRVENTVPLLHCNCCLAMAWHVLLSHQHGLGRKYHSSVVFYKPLPSNGWLLWLQNSCFEKLCHNIIHPKWTHNMYTKEIIHSLSRLTQ
jgi:hypothetical protein